MIVRFFLALLLLASFVSVAVPSSAVASDPCGACPAAGGAEEDCAENCPLCVCGPHRAPMTEPPAIPNPLLSPVVEFLAGADLAALAPAPHDILHVPRFAAVSPQS
ncbi:MAG: hypothetical protein AABZ94_02885 [Candidatus Eisenbacteria bacterium]